MNRYIAWLGDEEKKAEKKILADYSDDEIWKHIKYLTPLERREDLIHV